MLHLFTIKLSSTWDHYPVCAVLQEGEEGRGYVKNKEKRGWDGSHATKMQARIEFKKKVTQAKGDARKDCLETIQKDIEDGRKRLLTPQSWNGTGTPDVCRQKVWLKKGLPREV